MKNWPTLILISVLAACSAKPQTIAVTDAGAQKHGALDAYVIHYPKDSGDENVGEKMQYPDEHYGIGFKPSSTNPISDSDFDNVTAVAIKSKGKNQILTDNTYMCDTHSDMKGWFGCRLSKDAAENNDTIYLSLRLKDGNTWTTDTIDMEKNFESDSFSSEDASQNSPGTVLIISANAGKAKDFTLRLCPPDTDGKQIELPVSQCACAPGETYVWLTGTCENMSDSKKPDDASCPAPNYIDNTGKCVTVSQSQKDLCASGNYILLGGKGCGTTCGANQVAKMGKCVCQTNFILDPANPQNCIVNPALNQNLPVSAPSSGGGSCSLIRSHPMENL